MDLPRLSTRLQDIAERAGVSRMTVSRALRNQPRVSKETRQRILRIAEELGYHPNPMVSALMSHIAVSRQGSNRPGLVYVYPSSEVLELRKAVQGSGSYYEGVRARALQQGFEIEPLQVGTSEMTVQRFNGILKARGVQGVVIAPVLAPLRKRLVELDLEWDSFSAVAIGYSMVRPEIHRVCLDYYNGLLEGMKTLWDKGYRRFGMYISQETDQRIRHLWTSAFLTFHWLHGIEIKAGVQTPAQLERQHFVQWLSSYQPEILFSQLDEWIAPWYTDTVRGFRRACRFIHLDLDQAQTNVSDAGFGGHRKTIGAAAVDTLIGQIKRGERGIPAEPQNCLIKPKMRFLKPVW